jgi:hypothetical protein
MWNVLRRLGFSLTVPHPAPRSRPIRSTLPPRGPITPPLVPAPGPRSATPPPASLNAARKVSDRELAKAVLSRGKPRKWEPGQPLPKQQGTYRHIDAKTGKVHRVGQTFNLADRIPDHLRDPKLRKMSVQYQVARNDVTPPQLQAVERLHIKRHGTIGAGNRYLGGNGNIPKQFRQGTPRPEGDGVQA